MEAKKKPNKKDTTERNINDFVIGDRVKVNMHRGRIVNGTVKAVVNHTDGPRLQVDFGKDETALIHFGKSSKRLVDRPAAPMLKNGAFDGRREIYPITAPYGCA